MYTEVAQQRLNKLNVEIYADGANLEEMLSLAKYSLIKGFTTNPTLMCKAGIEDYEQFGRKVLKMIPNLPISLEVFADEFNEMEEQARYIATWGDNVNVKIPVTNTEGKFCGPIIQRLSADGVVLNVTAVMTLEQVEKICECLAPEASAIISVFAGRIADTGVDPISYMKKALTVLKGHPNVKLLWASPRELLNIFQADEIGCHIITVTNSVLDKLKSVGKNLEQFSLETVKMFYQDARLAGYTITKSLA